MNVLRNDILHLDVRKLQTLLDTTKVKCIQLVDLYLDQIHRHDGYLHGMLSMPSRDALQRIAAVLDEERTAGKVRSKLHGIPVIFKDNINTLPDLGMRSASSSFALKDARPRQNAKLVDKRGASSQWMVSNGRSVPAYVRGGLLSNDSKDGNSSPSGSSTGPAVVVSAGYAPLSVSTETDGSLVCPAGRASVYTIKPSIGVISQHGLIPVSHTVDSAGPMGKTPYDVAAFLDILRKVDASGYPTDGYTGVLDGSIADFSVAAVNYKDWIFPPKYVAPIESATDEMNRKFQDAYDILKVKVREFHENVPLPKPEAANLNGKNCKPMIMLTDFRHDFPAYLDELEFAPVNSLQELIHFNREHAEIELPAEQAEELNLTTAEFQRYLSKMREVCWKQGIDYILDKYNVDVIIGPADSTLSTIASRNGYPIAAMPLGFLDINGRAFGMVAMARKYQESTILKFLAV
ncbi:hypothetical protein IFR05_006867 [Cadophora sp. M221]|nr:hypothetical protein IFR05_006867 [Cadophora sp. M221]